MNGEVFFDTSVLLYALSGPDRHRAIVHGLLADGGTISVQVLNEFANVARRKLRLSWPETNAALKAIRTLCRPPTPLTIATHDLAMRVAASRKFSVYDSLIVAAALEAKCTMLLSEDLQDGQVIDGRLTVRNPFAA